MSVSILVVDDEPDVADLFRQCFRRETRQGTFVMHFAVSGVEALDRLAGEIQPPLVAILSDINMPGMDGLELLGEIKQRHPNLPVMMVTAHGDDERRRRARELGAFEFITKPLDFDQLKEQLRPSQRTETLVRCYKRYLVSRITPITSSQKHPKQKLSVLIPAPGQITCPTSTAVLGRSCG